MLSWQARNRTLQRGEIPLLMGIVNVTPDSFSDGGQYNSLTSAVDHALSLIEAGADILDIGGESTRPGATPVSVQEELDRTIPVVEALAKRSDVPLSIDTTKAEVARQAVAAGASIINDISGMTFDVQMVDVASRSQAGICLMHIKGTPQTMQQDPHYDNVVREVSDFLAARIQVCVAAGISRERICIDPGIGFGKTADHNLTLMKSIPFLRQTHHCPVLIGHSRKRFLSKILGRAVEERTAGTIGVSVALAENGADLLRVHDVRATRDALIAWKAVRL